MQFSRGESRLKARLKIARMTQSELAKRSGYSKQTISKFANGTLKMSADALYTLAYHLDCTMESLCHWDKKETTDS